MTSPHNPAPSPSENDSSATDPEWIKGVVAKALLEATAGEHGDTGSSIGTPIEPTPAVRAPSSWPTMSATIPEMAPMQGLPDGPVPLTTSITPPNVQLPDPKPLVIPSLSTSTPSVSAPTAPATPAVAPSAPSTTPLTTSAIPAATAPARPQAPPLTAPPMERPPRMASFAPAPLETEVAETIANREPETRAEATNVLATVPNPVGNGALLAAAPPSSVGTIDRVSEPRLGSDPHDEVMVEMQATTEGYRSSDLRTILEWLAVIVAALVVALLIKAFVLQAFWIPSESMETTVNEGDRILVNKVSYNLHEVRRGDLVVFEKLEGTPGETKDLIKRAIALPGETIEVRGDGRIWIWGPGETPDDAKLLEEPYLDPQNAILAVPSSSDPASQSIWDDRCVNQENPGRCTLDENSFFMMGDNRFRSLDSRSFGPVPAENIVGRAFLRIWPPGDISTL